MYPRSLPRLPCTLSLFYTDGSLLARANASTRTHVSTLSLRPLMAVADLVLQLPRADANADGTRSNPFQNRISTIPPSYGTALSARAAHMEGPPIHSCTYTSHLRGFFLFKENGVLKAAIVSGAFREQ